MREGLAGKGNAQRSLVKTMQSPSPAPPNRLAGDLGVAGAREANQSRTQPAVTLTADAGLSKSKKIQVQSGKAVARDQGPKGEGQCQRREQGPSLCVPADKGRKQAKSGDSM